MSESDQVGAIINTGPQDWQIFQHEYGAGEIELSGTYSSVMEGKVEVRLVYQDTGAAVVDPLDWHEVETLDDSTWQATLTAPSGGLYRLETRYNPKVNKVGELSARGDMRHFIGIGDIWVIAGQSNAAGYGRGPYNDPPELGVHVLRNNNHWALATHPINDTTDTKRPANREAQNPYHSPFLHFGRILRKTLGYPIGLLPTALGGSPLSMWNTSEPGGAPLTENMLNCIRQVGGRVKGVLWYQGETDCRGEKETETYFERFRDTVAVWRETLNAPELPIITVQLNRVYDPQENETEERWSKVREAQRRAAREIPNVAIVPSFDAALCDRIHNNAAGNLLIGERLARAALGMVYEKAVTFEAPDAVRATRERDGKEIHVYFEPVTSRIGNTDLRSVPFKAFDSRGEISIEKVAYLNEGRVALILGRTVDGDAHVHGAYGTSPPVVPMDMERLMPILGFYGLPVE